MPFSISGLLSSRETDIGQRDNNSPEMEKGMH
jgi:hypothetical protein